MQTRACASNTPFRIDQRWGHKGGTAMPWIAQWPQVIGGDWVKIHHNTFRAPQTPVKIRGVPEETCKVFNNWFPRHGKPDEAVRAQAGTHVENNAHGADPPKVIK